MGAIITQFFPPNPTYTEKNIGSQKGRVFIVTGGSAGVGLAAAKILYSKGGTVYIASRSLSKIEAVIKDIKAIPTDHPGGVLKSLHLDLADLTIVAKAASTFLTQETRLDVLFNNGGVGHVPAGSVTAQGYEVHMGTNCVGPFLFTKLLLPILRQTAKSSPLAQCPTGGISSEELQPDKHGQVPADNYSISKAGNWFLASEFDKLVRRDGIACVTQNPGHLYTDGWNNTRVLKFIFRSLLYDAIYGAYTTLWCGVSDSVKLENGGKYAIPWGRWHTAPGKDILESLKTREEGGTGLASKFWYWCEQETKQYV